MTKLEHAIEFNNLVQYNFDYWHLGGVSIVSDMFFLKSWSMGQITNGFISTFKLIFI